MFIEVLRFVKELYLMTDLNDSFGSIIALEKAFLEVVRLSWNPDGLLRVVGSHLILSLHLHGEKLKETITNMRHI